MSANLLSNPSVIAYNGDDLFFKFATNLIDADVQATVSLDISGAGPTVGEEISIEWPGGLVTFTVAANVNATATAWPAKSGSETLAEYAVRVAEAIRQNGQITEYWQVLTEGTAGSAERVQLKFRDRVALDVEVVNDLSNVVETVTDGEAPNTEPNLACMMQVWQINETENDDNLLGTLHSPYEAEAGTTYFNLRNFFNLAPHLPNPTHIIPGVFLSWLRGETTSNFTRFYIRANDKYGAPAVPLALIKSDDEFLVIHGASSLDREPIDDSSALVQVLHNYRRADGGFFEKPVVEYMPDWLYVIALQELTDCNVVFEVTWSDGQTSTEAYGGNEFTLAEGKGYFIRSTPVSFQGWTAPAADLYPWKFTFKLISGEVDVASVNYRIRPSTDWQRYILFDNGRGGCETVLMDGKNVDEYAAKRQLSETPRTPDTVASDGDIIAYAAEGQRKYTFNTGWVDAYYVEHLRQLLLGDAWLIDYSNERFLRLVVDTDSIDIAQKDQELFSLSVEFVSSWKDQAANV
jgi:hypothetical protein